jgi:hypothetical protein
MPIEPSPKPKPVTKVIVMDWLATSLFEMSWLLTWLPLGTDVAAT